MIYFIEYLKIIFAQIAHFIVVKVVDTYRYIRDKEWLDFNGYGLHIYVGIFGSGKTSTMVHDAYIQSKRYPQVTILTNMELINFPKHTKIIPLEHFSQIITAPANTLIIIDEISTVFNSRDWKNEGVPASLLGTLLQVRKQNKMIYATAQRFGHIDSLIRQITFSVRECDCYLGRWNFTRIYDGLDYDTRNGNTMHVPKCLKVNGFIQTDKFRELYDTKEMVEKMKKTKYLNDDEVVQKQSKVIA